MYLEIKTDDRSVILAALEKQIESGRAARASLGREGWLTTLVLSDEAEASATAEQTRAA